MKRILTMLTAALLLVSTVSVAQERGGNQNDLTLAVTAGYNGSVMQSAQPGNQPSYSVSSTNWNDKSLGLGVELGWFFVDLWRLNVGGGFSFTNTPGYPAVPGTVDKTWEAGDGSIPDYLGVANQNTMQFNVSLGFDRYFRTEVEGLLPFVGIKAGYAYGYFRTEVEGLLPFVGIKAGYAYGSNIAFMDDETWMGQSAGEAFNIRGAVTVGVDYYLSDGFFVGASIDPFAYTYNYTMIRPQDGLAGLAADSHNYSAFAAPTIRIGFCF